MKIKLATGAAIALAVFGFAATPASAVTPAATYDYSMAGVFDDSIGTSTLTPAATCASPAATDFCNVSANFGTDSNGNYWHWVTTQINGGGAVLDTPARIGGTYSLYYKFAIDNEANDINSEDCTIPNLNYSKILHFGELTNDVGLYTEGCNPLYVSTGFDTGDAAIARGEVVEVVVTRDDTTDVVTIFINTSTGYEESFVYEDTDGDFVAIDQGSGSRVRLFQDDGFDETAEGIQEGRLYGMKVWANTALTIDQLDGIVTGTDNLGETGIDSESLSALAGAGFVALAIGATVVARRRA